MNKLAFLTVPFMVAACGDMNMQNNGNDDQEHYSAVIEATEGNEASGTVMFVRTDEGIHVTAHIEGLQPNQLHGFHIHTFGDCSDNAEAAGGHFNPRGSDHGGRLDDERHIGDFGNLEADNQGVAYIDFVDDHLDMDGGNNILGRAVVIHGDRDDLESQPTGDAGARIGCGVIGVAGSR